MDQVRTNIQNWITKIHSEYKFEGLKILEVGCGMMDHNKRLFGEKNNITCTDVMQTSVTDQIADITELQFTNESFDMVICSETLEHVYEHRKAFSEMYRVLRPGGYLLITVPWEFKEHDEDYWRYSERTLNNLLAEYNFHILVEDRGFDGDRKTNLFRLSIRK